MPKFHLPMNLTFMESCSAGATIGCPVRAVANTSIMICDISIPPFYKIPVNGKSTHRGLQTDFVYHTKSLKTRPVKCMQDAFNMHKVNEWFIIKVPT